MGDERDIRIDVLRLDDGRIEYSVTAEDSVLFNFDFDLQEDGKVAWLRTGQPREDGTARGDLYWASPVEPSPHLVAPGVAAATLRVRRPATAWCSAASSGAGVGKRSCSHG